MGTCWSETRLGYSTLGTVEWSLGHCVPEGLRKVTIVQEQQQLDADAAELTVGHVVGRLLTRTKVVVLSFCTGRGAHVYAWRCTCALPKYKQVLLPCGAVPTPG